MLDTIARIDGEVLLWIQKNLRGAADPIFKAITYLNEKGALVILLCIALLLIPKTRKLGVLCTSALLVTFLLDNLILKNLIARTRPYEVVEGLTRLVGKQSDYSFPSGHTCTAFAVMTMILMECPKKIGVPAIILAVLIGFSRLYVGVHYPTDVLAGALTGILYAWIVRRIYLSLEKNSGASSPAQNDDDSGDDGSEDWG